MEKNIRNRSESQRGRPSDAQILAREKPTPLEVAPAEATTLPFIQPMKCPCCGRGMTPKVLRTRGNSRTITCTSCGRLMSITYGPNAEQVVTRL